jgi:hypothetical protein
MQSKERDRLSRIRQSLSQLAGEIDKLLPLFTDGLPMVKGTVYEQSRKCGKPTCACATGEPHRSTVLSRSEGGRTKLITIPTDRLQELKILTRRYQRFRRARARLTKIYKAMLSLIDQLEVTRHREP